MSVPAASCTVTPAIGVTGVLKAVAQSRGVAGLPLESVPKAWLIATEPFCTEAETLPPNERLPARPLPTTASQYRESAQIAEQGARGGPRPGCRR